MSKEHCPICNQQFEGDSHPCIGQISKRLLMGLDITYYDYSGEKVLPPHKRTRKGKGTDVK